MNCSPAALSMPCGELVRGLYAYFGLLSLLNSENLLFCGWSLR